MASRKRRSVCSLRQRIKQLELQISSAMREKRLLEGRLAVTLQDQELRRCKVPALCHCERCVHYRRNSTDRKQ